MASLSKSKTLFGFTSPRSVEKIIPEIKILIENLEGEKWSGSEKNQIKFFNALFESAAYDGSSMPKDIALAARDRITRAPKAFGFVDVKPTIQITDAGKLLFNEKRRSETFTRQMLKFQLPSPYHTQSRHLDFNVKPYLELLRLIHDLGSISKNEIALYFLQLVNIDKYEEVRIKILNFRENKKSFKGSYKMYVAKCFEEEISLIYEDEIISKKFKTRESTDTTFKKFLDTKRSNMLDYADAFIRHIKATELVAHDASTLRLIISKYKKEEVSYILSKTSRDAYKFKNEKEYKKFLFNPYSIDLLLDKKDLIIKKIHKLEPTLNINKSWSIDDLRNIYVESYSKLKACNLEKNHIELKDHSKLPDIKNVFDRIINKDINDPSLFLEWNVWRAFVMLNHGVRIQGNFALDLEGMPLSTAPGNQADIEVEFEDFAVLGEVTMSSGHTQAKMEQDSVPRHIGTFKKAYNKDTYCIFIAPTISAGSKSFFYGLNQIPVEGYGGKTKIIPMALREFVSFFEIGISNGFNNPKQLKNWLEEQWKYGQGAQGETDWYNNINNNIKNWTTMSN